MQIKVKFVVGVWQAPQMYPSARPVLKQVREFREKDSASSQDLLSTETLGLWLTPVKY